MGTPVLRGFAHRTIRQWMWESIAVGIVCGGAYFMYSPYPVEKAYEDFYKTYETPKGIMYEWLEKEPVVPKGFVLPDSIKDKYQEHIEEWMTCEDLSSLSGMFVNWFVYTQGFT